MGKNATLKTKLVFYGIILSLLPVLLATAISYVQTQKMKTAAAEETEILAASDLDHIVTSVHNMCEAQHELIEKEIDSSLNVARDVMAQTGQIRFSEESCAWDAVNQYTKQSQKIDLPKMLVGDTWLGNNTLTDQVSPVVDKVQDLVTATCTIFQRINNGDMLRVCTNVEKLDGTRAIGTYIPKINPDGKANPVVDTLLRGETFRGRAFVVNKWYITAYEPIKDDQDQVIGALYVGIPQENVVSLRKAIMDTTVGETGYIFVLNSKGDYVISADGKRDGENIWNAKDTNGTLFIQEICQKATASNGGIIEQRYPWKNDQDKEARMKITRVMYYEPWDWVIGAGCYLDEFYAASNRMDEIKHASSLVYIAVMGASITLAVLLWMFVSSNLTNKITKIINALSNGAEQVFSATTEISSASQSLAEGATEQAAGLEETSSSLEEMSAMTKQNADNAQQANILASDSQKSAQTGAQAMQRMSGAIEDIRKSSDETAKIIKVIDEIAFQTNLLALNAAVEAARAGEAGKGFAVVAEEVRNLAMRSADAAKNTANMIEESVKNSRNGVQISTEVSKVLEEIVNSISKTSDLVGEISAASAEQAQGIDQVNSAMSQMDKVTQQNAANAEESASAAGELKSQSEAMQGIVQDLVALVHGSRNPAIGQSPRQTAKSQPKHKLDAFHQIAQTKPEKSTVKAAAEIPFDSDDNFSDF